MGGKHRNKRLTGIAKYPAQGTATCSLCRVQFEAGKYNRYCPPCTAKEARAHQLRLNYNITPQEYDAMLSAQGGGCYICGRPPKTKRLAVDHDHKTGLVRGLLDRRCNNALSMFSDSPKRMLKAVSYLTFPPASEILGGDRFGIKGRVTNKSSTKRRLNPGYGKGGIGG